MDTTTRIFLIAAFLTPSVVLAAQPERSEAQQVAQQLVSTYRDFKTYHATWHVTQTQGQDDAKERTHVTIAFQRDENKVLVRLQQFSRVNDEWKAQPNGMLLVHDGKQLSFAARTHPGEDWRSKVTEAPDPLTYRHVRRTLQYFYPVDLPLMMSEHPFMEWLQAQGGQFELTERTDANDKKQRGFVVRGPYEGQPPITAWLVQKGDREILGEVMYGPMHFKPRKVGIDKPLKDDTFEFEHHLKELKASTE